MSTERPEMPDLATRLAALPPEDRARLVRVLARVVREDRERERRWKARRNLA